MPYKATQLFKKLLQFLLRFGNFNSDYEKSFQSLYFMEMERIVVFQDIKNVYFEFCFQVVLTSSPVRLCQLTVAYAQSDVAVIRCEGHFTAQCE